MDYKTMNNFQQIFVLGFAVINTLIFLKAFHEVKHKQNPFGLTYPLVFIGSFVWGDAVIFGLFWTLASLVTWWLKDWNLFLLIVSLFWVVRSLGETIYWLNQQFSSLNRNPIQALPLIHIFHNDSIWFVYQIIWQCTTVISVIFSIYFAWAWLGHLT
jgi:hypothetical protein